MKRAIQWGLLALVLLLAAAGAMRVLGARKQEPVVNQAKAQAVAELAAADIARAETLELAQGLPVSGSLRAVNSAVVKARVAGELLGLKVREGDTVKAGQEIARVDATESQARLRQAREQADAAKAQIDIAQRQWDNNKALVDQGFISKTALDTSLNNLHAAQATHKAALAAAEVARKSVDDTVLRAPISGVVSQRLAQPGERVGIDARVVEIVDLSRLELEATLSAADSVQVRVGQEAKLQVEGLAQPIAARVVRINPSAQAGSRSVLVYLAIAESGGLRQGLFAQGQLAIGKASGLAVPQSSVRTDKPAPYVQVVENGVVVHKPVTTGARGESQGENWVAVNGVASGSTVIKGHLGVLRERTAVKFTSAGGGGGSGAMGAAAPPPQPSPGGGGSKASPAP